MSEAEQLLVGLAMAAGLVGILVPVVPGLLLILAAGLWWTIADGGGAVRWTVFAVLTALFVPRHGGQVRPARPLRRRPRRAGVHPGRRRRGRGGRLLRHPDRRRAGRRGGRHLPGGVPRGSGTAARAWVSTRAALVAIGVGLLIELTAGALMLGVWLLGLSVT